ncbi:ribonuclease H-like domain-containing protein [Tanacetum coccineum]
MSPLRQMVKMFFHGEGSSITRNEPQSEVRRSTRQKTLPVKFSDFVVSSNVRYGLKKYACYANLFSVNYCFSTTLNKSVEPNSYIDSCKNENWVTAINQEIEALHRNNTRVVADFPVGRKAIVKMVTVRYLIGLVVFNNWPLYQLDVNNAFLYSDLHEEVYMSLPPGYYDKNETKVCRFVKSLYGLKQAPRQWNEKLTCALIENGFIQSKNDYSLYVKGKKGIFTALLVCVDDIDVTGNNHAEIEKFKQFLSLKFMIKDIGKLKYFMGIEVLENQNGVYLSQRKYCLELLSDYGLLACKPAATQLQQNIVFSFKESEKDNRHMHAPLQSHFAAGLRVLRYLKQAPGTGIHFYKCNKISLHAFSDADWAKCPKSRKCVSEDLDVEGLFPVNLFCDSSFAIQITSNLVFHEKTKHFETDLHLVRGKVSSGVIKTVKIRFLYVEGLK